MEVLGAFENHADYNGVFIGKKNQDWHLEFTQSNEVPSHIFDEDDLFVFYLQTQKELNIILKKLKENNIAKVLPKKPYWLKNGETYLDPDGYRIVLCKI